NADPHSFPTRRSSDLEVDQNRALTLVDQLDELLAELRRGVDVDLPLDGQNRPAVAFLDVKPKIHVRSLRALRRTDTAILRSGPRSEEHTSELQSLAYL